MRCVLRLEEHVRNPRMRGKPKHFSTAFRDPVLFKCAKLVKQLQGLAYRARRWRCDPCKFVDVIYTPLTELEHEWREIGVEDLRIPPRDKMLISSACPKAITCARAKSPGASCALIG